MVNPRVGFQDREAFGAAAKCDRSIVFESPRCTISFHHFGKRKLSSVWSQIQQLQEYLLYITCLFPGIPLFSQDQFRQSCVVRSTNRRFETEPITTKEALTVVGREYILSILRNSNSIVLTQTGLTRSIVLFTITASRLSGLYAQLIISSARARYMIDF